MKKIIYLSLFVAMLALAGCATDPIIPESPSKESTAAIDPEIIAMIEEMGYSTESIRETEDAYIVEGDVSILKDYLEELKNGSKTRALSDKGVLEWSYAGGTLTGPELEPGDVLYTNKNYDFFYDPYRSGQPGYGFSEVAIGICKGYNSYPGVTHDPENTIHSLSNISLHHTFTEPGQYTVAGNSVWKRVQTTGGLFPTTTFYWGEYRKTKTYKVIDPLSLLTITGTNPTALNVNATYSVPATLPEGITFTGWTPISGATSSNWNSPTLIVKFTAYKTYTLTANFRLPDGTNHPVKRTIRMSPPPLPTPIVSASQISVREGMSVTFSVSTLILDNGNEVLYQWEVDDKLMVASSNSYFSIIARRPRSGISTFGLVPNPSDWFLKARCRVIRGEEVSAWSSTVSVLVTPN